MEVINSTSEPSTVILRDWVRERGKKGHRRNLHNRYQNTRDNKLMSLQTIMFTIMYCSLYKEMKERNWWLEIQRKGKASCLAGEAYVL